MTDRELVSRLIVLVVTGRMTVRDAILHFPKDTNDKNLMAAYHALIHYEADEDQRSKDFSFNNSIKALLKSSLVLFFLKLFFKAITNKIII